MRVNPLLLIHFIKKMAGRFFRNQPNIRPVLIPVTFLTFIFILLLPAFAAASDSFSGMEETPVRCLACDNVSSGGAIQGEESGCPSPVWYPSAINSAALPTGGSGELEYVWVFTTDDPDFPYAQWWPIPNSNSPNYTPVPISVTTYYRRLARRAGCAAYAGESNIIAKIASCCDNVTDGGKIGSGQHFCGLSFDPAPILNLVYPNGGSGDYEFLWMMSLKGTPYYPGSPDWSSISGANGESYDLGLVVQNTYFIRLARRSGCSDFVGVSNMAALTISPAVKASITGADITCAGGSNGAIQLEVSGGTTPFNFNWTPHLGDVQNPQGLAAGNYVVTISDAFDCSAVKNINLKDGSKVTLSLSKTDETCLGGSNGAAEVISVGGGTPGYSYLWSDAANSTGTYVAGLAAGSYAVTATDANGCTAVSHFSIAAGPPLGVLLGTTNESCLNAGDGTATVLNVIGGIPGGYLYQWNDPSAQTGSKATELPAGNWTVTVNDSQGCIGTASALIHEGLPLNVSVISSDETCLGANNGRIEIIGTDGGTGVYSYQWSDPLAQTGSLAYDLAPGAYTVTATDSQGCIGTAGAEVESGPALVLSLAGIAESCLGANNGSAEVLSVVGSTGPLTYLWNDPFSQTTASISGIAPGAYSVTATDSQGCIGSASVQVGQGPMLNVATSAAEVSCYNGSDGQAIILSVSGGSGNYSFYWNDPNGQSTPTATNLSPGTYEVLISDDQGCVGLGSATVENALPLEISSSHTDAQCHYTADGAAEVNVTGGTAPYLYQWSDPGNQSSQAAFGLAIGTYSVTVTDAKGCTVIATETIQAPAEIVAVTSSTSAACADGQDGSVSVSIQNGNPADFQFQWSDPAGSTTPEVSGLPQGTYSVTITDINGCEAISSALVAAPPPLELNMQAEDVSCYSGEDGAVSVEVSGGTAFGTGYQYIWNALGHPTTPSLSEVPAGVYSLTVTDANGCTAIGTKEVQSPEVLSLSATSAQITCAGFENGSATALATGGTAPYTYYWNNTSNSNGQSQINLGPGAYGVTVTDAQGCTAASEATVFEPPTLDLTIAKTDILCPGDNTGSATAQPDGGVFPYFFKWDNGETTQSLSQLHKGDYHLTVTDGNGCSITGGISILATTDLSLEVAAADANCFDSNDGTATAHGLGGIAPYTFVWSNGKTSSSIFGLAPGDYSVTVADAGGCTVESTAQVGAPSQLTSQAQIASHISSYNGSNGSASATATGGTPPYSFLWDNGSADPTAVNLSAGMHSVTITDAKGCTSSSEVMAPNPSKIGNFVWNDLNQNGIQDIGEPGVSNIALRLFGTTALGAAVFMETQTSAFGAYAFDGLQSGSYRIEVELPASYAFSPTQAGSDALDSDINPTTGSSEVFTLEASFYDDRRDVGLIFLDEKINIGDFVWEDANQNGIQDMGEQGLANVPVRLISMPANEAVGAATTDASGKYLFKDIAIGIYVVEFSLSHLPDGYAFSPQNQGGNHQLDSDPNPATGRTAPFQVLPFTLDNLSLDAGIFKKCDNVADGGKIGYDETLCGPTAHPAAILSLAEAEGGAGELEYRWLLGETPTFNGINDPNWAALSNSNSADFQPGSLSQTAYYIRLSKRQGCANFSGNSNIVAKTIAPEPTAQIKARPNELCQYEKGRFEAVNAGEEAAYFWEFGDDATPATAATRTADGVYWSSGGLKTIQLTTTRSGCSFSTLAKVLVGSCSERPIEFDNISVALNDWEAEIAWKVLGDASQALFFVQRSEDGSLFENLAAVPGEDESESSVYSFSDSRPRIGKSFYRIRAILMNDPGKEIYSEVVSVNNLPKAVGNVLVYPNPTPDKATIHILAPNGFPVFVQVTDMFGKILESVEVPAMTEKHLLDMSAFPQGVYLVYLKQKGHRERALRVARL